MLLDFILANITMIKTEAILCLQGTLQQYTPLEQIWDLLSLRAFRLVSAIFLNDQSCLFDAHTPIYINSGARKNLLSLIRQKLEVGLIFIAGRSLWSNFTHAHLPHESKCCKLKYCTLPIYANCLSYTCHLQTVFSVKLHEELDARKTWEDPNVEKRELCGIYELVPKLRHQVNLSLFACIEYPHYFFCQDH